MALTLTVTKRSPGSPPAKDLCRQGMIPGVLYGHNVKNQPIQCPGNDLHKVYLAAGESTVIDLMIDGDTIPVLIHAIDLDPVSNEYRHIDLYAPDMTKKVTAPIPLRISGEAPAVKNLGGMLIHNRDTITVSCLPKNLPHDIEVDVTHLAEFNDSITVADLSIPAAVSVQENEEEIVATVLPPRTEEKDTEATTEGDGEGGEEGGAPAEGGETATSEEGKAETTEKK